MALPQSKGELVIALSQHDIADSTLGETVERVATLVRQALPQATAVGVLLLDGTRPGSALVRDPDGLGLDAAMDPATDTPVRRAVEEGESFVAGSTSTAADHRRWCEGLAERGVRSVLVVPLLTARSPIGALCLGAEKDNAFSPADVEDGLEVAATAAHLLLNARSYWEARGLADNLRQALASRAAIEQAKGILIGALGCSADEAFSGSSSSPSTRTASSATSPPTSSPTRSGATGLIRADPADPG